MLVLKLGVTVFLLLSGLSLSGQNTFDVSNLEAFDVNINFEEIGSYTFPAFYEDPDGLYIPVDALMNLLKIVRTATPDGQVIKGFVETENNFYEINYPERFMTFKEKRITLAESEALMDMGTLYIRGSALERAFGFKIVFDFRSLSAKFSSEFELPVIRIKKQEKIREKLGGHEEGVLYDTIFPRDYHWVKGAMLDWSVASNQSQSYSGETRMELGGGAEIFGGETNILLNWSNKYGMDRQQQQYYWKWADNDAKVVKQIQLGRISSRSIASLLSPVDGFVISNTPTTVRKALGEYRIAEYTEPDWMVELYVNNVLISYTKSDASGFYTFNIPIVYGTSNMVLRFYGPGGEVRSEEKKFTMPYNMLPSGEMEYRITGGSLIDSTESKYGRAEINYGIARWLTAGIGMEYMSTIKENPEIPFANFTFQPFSKMLITGEYAYKVRAKGTMNLSLPAHSSLELAYAKYEPGQKAIIYNYLEEKSGGLSVPYKIYSFSGYTKLALRQNIYTNFKYNSGEFMLSGNYRNYSLNMSNFMNWTDGGNSNIYSNLTLGVKLGKNINIRPSAQYNYTANKIVSFKTELETKIFKNGNLSLRYEKSLLADYNNINVTFRYDLPYMSTYISSGLGSNQFQASESARGSLALGSGNKYVYANKRGTVGRSGITLETFVDINFNGKRDKGEPFTEPIKVKCSGGQMVENHKDSVVRIVGLEPFVDYTLTLDESGFESLTWRLPFKTMKVTTDPNQFKKISIPVQPMGEISGMVSDDSGNGIGRILINFIDKDGNQYARTLSESDGYFTYIGFKPGDYTVCIDSMQLVILKKEADPISVTVKPDVEGDIVDAGNIEWRNIPGLSDETIQDAESREMKSRDALKSTTEKDTPTLRVIKFYYWNKEIGLLKYNDGSYCLQLGAFKIKENALKVYDELKKAFPENIVLIEDEFLFKIRTTPAMKRKIAIGLAEKIKASGILSN